MILDSDRFIPPSSCPEQPVPSVEAFESRAEAEPEEDLQTFDYQEGLANGLRSARHDSGLRRSRRTDDYYESWIVGGHRRLES
jgi:hypothetical protein